MPIAGTSMRAQHAVKPEWTGRCRRRTRTVALACRGSLADRDTRPCDLFRRNYPAWDCFVPNSRTTHLWICPRSADPNPECMTLPRIARPQPRGEPGRICAALRRFARRRMPSPPPCGLRRLQHLAPGGTAKDRAGRTSSAWRGGMPLPTETGELWVCGSPAPVSQAGRRSHTRVGG